MLPATQKPTLMNHEEKNHLILLQEIIDTSYRLLIRRLAFGSVTARNEAAFQLEFGHILKTVGQLYEFGLEDKFDLEFETYIPLGEVSVKSRSDRARIDLLLHYKDEEGELKAAIELKFFKKENHREPNYRYDVFTDLFNLELYKSHGIDLCYFVLATDHAHYYTHKGYERPTADFDFRHKSTYEAGKVLTYKTDKPHGDPIRLRQSYTFLWDQIQDLYFLKVKV
jgi:hypothetical protein